MIASIDNCRMYIYKTFEHEYNLYVMCIHICMHIYILRI